MLNFFKTKWGTVVLGVLLVALFYTIAAFLSAGVFYLLHIDRNLIPFFSNISLALSSFLSVYLITREKGDKGLVTGLLVGGCCFVLIFIVSIFTSKRITLNTLFHLLFIMLPAAIGGIMGVNKTNKIM